MENTVEIYQEEKELRGKRLAAYAESIQEKVQKDSEQIIKILVHQIIINWLYLDLILHQQPALLLDLFHQAYMSSDKQQAPC